MKNKYLILLGLGSLLLGGCGPTPINPNDPDDPNPSSDTQYFSVYFKDENQLDMYSAELEEGTIPSFTYDKSYDPFYEYDFVGWSDQINGEVVEMTPIHKNTFYYAIVREVTHKDNSIHFSDDATDVKTIKKEASIAIEETYNSILNSNTVLPPTLLSFVHNTQQRLIYKDGLDNIENLKQQFNYYKHDLLYFNSAFMNPYVKAVELQAMYEYLFHLIEDAYGFSDIIDDQVSQALNNARLACHQIVSQLDDYTANWKQTIIAAYNDYALTASNLLKDYIADFINTVKTGIKNQIITLKNNIISKLRENEYIEMVNNLYTSFTNSLDGITSFKDLNQSLDDLFETTKDALENSVVSIISLIKGVIVNLVNELYQKYYPLITDSAYKFIIEDLYNSINNSTFFGGLDTLEKVYDYLDEIKGLLAMHMSAILSNIRDNLAQTVNNALNNILDFIGDSSIKEAIQAYIQEKIAALSTVTDIDDIKEGFQAILDKISSFISSARNKALIVLSTFKEFLKIDLGSFPTSISYENTSLQYEEGYEAPKFDEDFVDVDDAITGFGEQWSFVLQTFDNLQTAANFISPVVSVIANGFKAASLKLFDEETTLSSFEIDKDNFKFSLSYSETEGTSISLIVKGDEGKDPRLTLLWEEDIEDKTYALIKKNNDNFFEFDIDGSSRLIEYKADVLGLEGKFYWKTTQTSMSGYAVRKNSCKTRTAYFLTDYDYLTVYGNVASFFTNLVNEEKYIYNELYDYQTGALLGYGRRHNGEFNKKYNSLWFNLSNLTGITNIKFDGDDAYLNDSSDKFVPDTQGTLVKARLFDFELVTHTILIGDKVKDIKTPMLFIENDDNFNDHVASIATQINNFGFKGLTDDIFNKLKSDYTNYTLNFEEKTL